MNNVSWEKNVLFINGHKTIFNQDIYEILEFEDYICVITDPMAKTYNNLYGISVVTQELWQIEDIRNYYPKFIQTPYVGLGILDGQLVAIDFCGGRYVVNHLNGKIIKSLSCVR